MVGIGKIIEVKFNEGRIEYYFRSGNRETSFGKWYEVFCRVKPQENIDFTDIWLISEEYYKKMEEKGMIREINTFADLIG